MSKAKGNVVEPWAVIDKYGADALRWYFFTASPPGNARRFSEKLVSEVTRQFLLTLWNVYSFFITYANIDKFTPVPEASRPEPSELDRWIMSELNQLIADVDRALDSYNPTEAGRKIEGFVSVLSNWYVRRSRRRFWKSENDADKLAAYNTLYECLVTLTKLLAPFTPFLAEELYQNLVRSAFPEAPNSVHLADFPVADETKIDEQLTTDTRLAMKVSSLGRAARSQAGIKVRQPLAEVIVSVASNTEQKSLERLKPQIMEELNVKYIKLATPEELSELAKKDGYVVDDEAAPSTAIYKHLSEDPKEAEELRKEGMAREIVHQLQWMRRQAGFDIADHIVTYYDGNDKNKRVITEFSEYIKRETLSSKLIEGIPEPDISRPSHGIITKDLKLAVARLD